MRRSLRLDYSLDSEPAHVGSTLFTSEVLTQVAAASTTIAPVSARNAQERSPVSR